MNTITHTLFLFLCITCILCGIASNVEMATNTVIDKQGRSVRNWSADVLSNEVADMENKSELKWIVDVLAHLAADKKGSPERKRIKNMLTDEVADMEDRTAHNRIAAGKLANLAVVSYIVFINWYWTQTRVQRGIRPVNLTLTVVTNIQCTGAIIGAKWVLTTAACFQPCIEETGKSDYSSLAWQPRTAYARAGAYDAWDHGWDDAQPNTQTRKIFKIYVHREYLYQSTMFDVDIALAMTNAPFLITSVGSTGGVKLPLFAYGMNATQLMQCAVVGYGKASPDQRGPARPLRWYEAVMGSHKYCRELELTQRELGTGFRDGRFYDEQYQCARATDGSRSSTCVGDKGALIVCDAKLVGLLSQRVINPGKPDCDGRWGNFGMFVGVARPIVFDWVRFYLDPDTPAIVNLPSRMFMTEWRPRVAEAAGAGGCLWEKGVWRIMFVVFIALLR